LRCSDGSARRRRSKTCCRPYPVPARSGFGSKVAQRALPTAPNAAARSWARDRRDRAPASKVSAPARGGHLDSGIPVGIAPIAPPATRTSATTRSSERCDGGFTENAVADAAYVFSLAGYDDAVPAAAPLMSAGLNRVALPGRRRRGRCYRDLRVRRRSAHHRAGLPPAGAPCHSVTRRADSEVQAFPAASAQSRRRLRPGSARASPRSHSVAPAGTLVPIVFRHVRKGGRVVCGGMHRATTRIPLSPAVVGTANRRAPISGAGTPRIFSPSRARALPPRCGIGWRRPTTRSSTCGAEGCRAPPCFARDLTSVNSKRWPIVIIHRHPSERRP
jgi:hypothetical protein